MTISTACILAAGMGSRMGPSADPCPKGFIRLGERPIVVESIERLRSAGISRVVVVAGFMAEYYRGLEGVEVVLNEAFRTTGTLASLRTAQHLLDDDFLLLESDIIYEQRALEVCLASRERNLIVASGPRGAGDEVWIAAGPDGLLKGLSKDAETLGPDRLGEAQFIGISRVSQPLLRDVCALQLGPAAWYDTDGFIACLGSHRIGIGLVEDLLWAEIDDPAQLRLAREVYARISAESRPAETNRR